MLVGLIFVKSLKTVTNGIGMMIPSFSLMRQMIIVGTYKLMNGKLLM